MSLSVWFSTVYQKLDDYFNIVVYIDNALVCAFVHVKFTHVHIILVKNAQKQTLKYVKL